MQTATLATVLGLSTLISACTNTEDPQLAMCQAVAKQLTGNSVSAWEKINQSDSARLRTINIAYEGADSSKGAIDCSFPIDKQGVIDTAPKAVTLNGQTVPTKTLLTAGVKASAELLKGTAANTVAKSKELANEAREVANDARDIASDVASDAADIASDVADIARDAAVETSKVIQEKLDNQ